jgi:hypothetical protein
MNILSLSATGYQFFQRRDVHSFKDKASAVQFLTRFKKDGSAISALRRILAEGGGSSGSMTDAQVLDEVAARMSRGDLVICYRRNKTPSTTGDDEQAAAPEPSTATAMKAPVKRDEPDQPTFSNDHDVRAQVGTLVAAAASGVPFCEECAKAAALKASGQQGAAS